MSNLDQQIKEAERELARIKRRGERVQAFMWGMLVATILAFVLCYLDPLVAPAPTCTAE